MTPLKPADQTGLAALLAYIGVLLILLTTNPVAAAGDDKTPNKLVARQLATFEGDFGITTAFNRDGSRLLAVGLRHIGVWDAKTRQPILTLTDRELFRAAAFSPDGSTVVTVVDRAALNGKPSIQFWDATSGAPGESAASVAHARSAAFSPDGKQVVIASQDGTVRTIDVKTGRQALLLKHETAVEYAVFSPDGSRIATVTVVAGLDRLRDTDSGFVRLWDARTGQNAWQTPSRRIGTNRPLAFSPDGKQIATSDRGLLHIWRLEDMKLLHTVDTRMGMLEVLEFSPDAQQLLALSRQKLRIWDVATAQPRSPELIDEFAAFYDARFDPQGLKVVTAAGWGRFALYDSQTLQKVADLTASTELRPSGVVPTDVAVSFSTDGKHVLTGDEGREQAIWWEFGE